MESTKINFRAKILLSLSRVSLVFLCFSACDVFEPDADIIDPKVTVSEEQVYVYGNNATFIDLTKKVATNQPVRFTITSPPQSGQLAELGKGLLQYTLSSEAMKTRDAFEFTIFSQDNKILTVDTVEIAIERDSTKLPCGIYPADDYVFGVKRNVTVVINVLANDYVCRADSADLRVSIVTLGGGFPPYTGQAEVVGNHSLSYTAGAAFEGADKIVYKVDKKSQPGAYAYGIVYLAAEDSCDVLPRSDVFTIDRDTLQTYTVHLPVLLNDDHCNADLPTPVNEPVYGTLVASVDGFAYRVHDTVNVSSTFKDYFTYQICDSDDCKTTIVKIQARASAGSCSVLARTDTVDLSGNAIPLMYLAVLQNDELCGGYSSFEITQEPRYGSAFVSDEMEAIAYERNPEMNKNDSLEYKICRAQICSRAKVYIKRE